LWLTGVSITEIPIDRLAVIASGHLWTETV